MSSYHGWTHRPKSQGGTDPIEGDFMPIATDTACFGSGPNEIDINPHRVSDIPATLVAVSVANVVGVDALNVYIYDENDVGDVTVGTNGPRWVVPGPSELGAVPFVPIKFYVGIIAAVVKAIDDTVIDVADYPGLKVTYAYA